MIFTFKYLAVYNVLAWVKYIYREIGDHHYVNSFVREFASLYSNNWSAWIPLRASSVLIMIENYSKPR